MSVPKEVEQQLLYRLYDELLHGAELNAALGYAIDPKLPAPEVFERPGWRVVWAARGAWRFEIATLADRLGLSEANEGYDPSATIKYARDSVEPLVHMEVETVWEPMQKRRYGLGIHVPSRTWVIFHDLGT